MKVYLNSIGCRLNQSEIETIGRQLVARGHEIVSDPDQAHSILINTCAVTGGAARDARAVTRRLRRRNPGAEILLTGCYATIAPAELAQIDASARVIPNKDKNELLRILDPQANGDQPAYDQEPILREFLFGHFGNTRAFVKVQDGCDNRCTFCVTTIARGSGVSRPLQEIIVEIQALAAAGYREVVLTGVHLGSYGQDLQGGHTLQALVRACLADTDIPRLRLSSLEPWDIDPDFFTLWSNPRLLPHLHLPLQSGSDKILRRMARRTSRTSFRQLVHAARTAITDLSISTDIILGFPGETVHDFQQSMDFVREIEFARLHAFTYSRRPGTAAANMPNQVPPAAKKERTRQMIELGKSLSLAFHAQFLGESRPVLWENTIGADQHGLRWAGYTDNYIRVVATGPADLFNRISSARLNEARADHVMGSLAEHHGE